MRRRALHVVCVAVLLVTAGCTGLPGGDGGTDAAAVQSDAVDAMGDVETYRMTMVMNVSANGQTMTVRQRGVFDHATERARLNLSMLGRQSATYVDGSTMYAEVGGRWQARNLSGAGLWENGTSADRQREILESGDVSVEGSATVDGTETTVLGVDPDAEDLQALVQQRSGGSLHDVGVDNATYTVYVADETDRVRRVEFSLTMTAGDQAAQANATITFSDYGEPVNVSIPDAATEGTDGEAAIGATGA